MKEYKKACTDRIKDYFHGILHVDSQSTRSLLNTFIEDCLQKIQNYLYEYTKKEMKETLNIFQSLNSSISIPIETLEDYS